MLYRIFRVTVRFALKMFFRHIDLEGLQHIKPGKAQILASNHPAGFLEPLLMACFFPRSLYFLVRGDIFENSFLRPILLATHQIPIFRFKDGFSKLRENKQSMNEATSVLLQNKCILIFVEGSTKSVKMLRPLQKGFVRLALDAKTSDPQNPIEIVPVGINFSNSSAFRSDVMIRVENPIVLDGECVHWDNVQQTAGTTALMKETFEGMEKNIIHMTEPSRVNIMEKMFLLFEAKENRTVFSEVSQNDHFLSSYKNIAAKIQTLSDEKIDIYRKDIKKLSGDLKNEHLTLNDLGKSLPKWYHWLGLILGFLPAFIGFLLHIIPLLVSFLFTRINVKSKEFYGAIWFVTNIVSILIYYVIGIILFIVFLFPFYWIIIVPVSGYFARKYYDMMAGYYWGTAKKQLKFRAEASKIYEQFRTA
ncbi:MAG: 1-acyl-sn-glycerol-3-phosphate acyltransferase [Saprospiraceae bacterium]|nr:1-acyl-sn-glycerol-3-phosphate acyltransferase [Saprospiraceae bacterium]